MTHSIFHLKQLLNEPFTQTRDLKYYGKWSFFYGIFAFCIAYFVRPYHALTWQLSEPNLLKLSTIISVAIGITHQVSVTVVVKVSYFVTRNGGRWKVYHQLLNYAFQYLSSSTSLYLSTYYGLGFTSQLPPHGRFMYFLSISSYILLGIVIYTFFEYYSRVIFTKLSASSLSESLQVAHTVSQEQQHDPMAEITFRSEDEKTLLKLHPQQLMLVQAEGNYIMLYWNEPNHRVEKTLIRLPIGVAEKLLTDYSFFFRCHRSYIINLNEIRKLSGSHSIKGNARGLAIKLASLDIEIPVARNRIDEFKVKVKNMLE